MGGLPGKIDNPLNTKLSKVKWGCYKVRDLFNIDNTTSFNTDKLVVGFDYDYVTRTSLNQGVLCSTGYVNSNYNSSGNWSLGLLQMDFFFRNKPWYAGQFVRRITPKFSTSHNAFLFLTMLLNGLRNKLLTVLVRNVDETFLESNIYIPATDKGEIDFNFMDSFISELKDMHMEQLYAYINEHGYNNYELSIEERDALSMFSELRNDDWGTYKVGKLFEKIKTKKLPYKAKELPKQPIDEYVVPCLTSSFQNQGLNYYVPKMGATILSNVISIPSNSDVYRAYYQSRDFTVLSDAYAIRWKSNEISLSPNHYLFMVMCINKVTDLPIYSYKNKLGGWNVVKEKIIALPKRDGNINFEFIELFMSALKKLAIQNVVKYVNSRLLENNTNDCSQLH